MKADIVNEKDNKLLRRKELKLNIDHEGRTPSKAELQQLLSKQLSKQPEFIDIRNIFSGKGIAKSNAVVFIWEEKKVEDLAKAVAEKKKAEQGGEAEKPKEEAKPAAEEAPKEEKKTESKDEKPKEGKEKKKEETKEESK